MAQALKYVCDRCEFSVVSWSDGNPYFINEKGKKEYAYHPNHEALARCIGNDSEFICLDCCKEFRVDSRKPRSSCPKCKSKNICGTGSLEGKKCPSCKEGTIKVDDSFYLIS